MKTDEKKTNRFKRTIPPKGKKDKTPPDGSFLMVDKKMLREHGVEMAVFMANLIDKYLYFLERFPQYNGDFFLPHKDQIPQTGLMSDHKVRKCKQKAIENDWIEVRLKGSPAKEWYRLNLQHIDIQAGIKIFNDKGLKFLMSSPQNSLGLIRKTNKENINKDIISSTKVEVDIDNNNSFMEDNKNDSSHNKESKSSIQEKNKKYLSIAKYLAGIISSNKNIHYPAFQLNGWAGHIRQLVENYKVDKRRVQTALRWYKQHCGEPFVPVIESGKSLRDKFTKLEDAIQRDNSTPTKEIKQGSTPEEIIQNNVEEYRWKPFTGYYDEARKVINTENGQDLILAKNMVGLYQWIKNNQGNGSNCTAPILLIQKYTDYIDDQSWITDKTPNLYQRNNTVFKKFTKEYEDEVGLKPKVNYSRTHRPDKPASAYRTYKTDYKNW